MKAQQIQVFQNKEFGQVRVVEHNGEPWFVAKDVCAALDLNNIGQALASLDEDEKASIDPNIIKADVGFDVMMQAAHMPMRAAIPEAGRGGRPLGIITEPGLYSLILRSRKPEAKAFKRWVTHDILPAIRKSGGYMTAKPDDTPETILARAVLIAQDTLKRVEAERDEAVRTKAWIGSRREATAMATAASATRRAKALEAQLGLAGDYLAVKGIKWLPEIFDLTKGGTYSQIGKYLKRLSLTENYMVKTAPDSLHESVGLYHKDIIALFRKQLAEIPSLMRKYRHADASHAA